MRSHSGTQTIRSCPTVCLVHFPCCVRVSSLSCAWMRAAIFQISHHSVFGWFSAPCRSSTTASVRCARSNSTHVQSWQICGAMMFSLCALCWSGVAHSSHVHVNQATHMKNVHPFNAACRKASVIVFPSARCALQITKSERTHVGIGDGAKRHILRMLDLQEGVQ